MDKDIIEIPLCKRKMTLSLLGSMLFVICGIWFVVNPPKISKSLFGNTLENANTIVIFSIGLASILFFGFVAIIILRKLFDEKPGLIVSSEGVIDNYNNPTSCIILWSDIEDILTMKISTQKFIMILIKNPQNYIDKTKSSFKRYLMKVNNYFHGSPIVISANPLQINFEELKQLLGEKFNQYKK